MSGHLAGDQLDTNQPQAFVLRVQVRPSKLIIPSTRFLISVDIRYPRQSYISDNREI